jgi:hypothetical protein
VFVEKTSDMRDAVLSRVQDGDVVITMGAGSIGHLAPELAVPPSEGIQPSMLSATGSYVPLGKKP